MVKRMLMTSSAPSAAYAQLRTPWGRSEALADLAADREPATTPIPVIPVSKGPPPGIAAAWPIRAALMLPAWIRHGRRRTGPHRHRRYAA